MSKKIRVVLSMMLILAMAFNIAACSSIENFFDLDHSSRSERSRRDRDRDDDDDDDDDDAEPSEEPDETEPDETEPGETRPTVSVSDELTYPDHIASYEEIHPVHANGTVRGDAAVEILDNVEHELLVNELGSSYVNAVIVFEDYEDFGITFDEGDIGWGEVMSDHEEDAADVAGYLEQLYTIDRDSLSLDDRIFYDKIVYDLELSAYALQYTAFEYYESVFKPITGPQSEVLFILDVLEFRTVEDAQNYILVLRDLDRYYDEICDFEEERAAYGYINSDDVYEEVAGSFDNLVSQADDCFLYESFRSRLDNIPGLSTADYNALVEEHDQVMAEIVFPEFQECADRIRALKCGAPDVGVSSYPGGDAYFAYVFATQTNSGRTLDESIDQLEAYTDSVVSTMMSAAANMDDTIINEYLNHDYSVGDTRENLDYMYEQVQGDFPPIPDHGYRLLTVPEVFADDFSPAAFLGYHVDNFDSNIVITNEAQIGDTFGITCAHEGYPGHMYESIYHRCSTRHPYMYVADSIGYAEGWATYVENYSFKYFSTTPASTLIRIENQLNIILFARFDLGVNYEGWSLQDCADWYSGIMGSTVPAESFADAYNLLLSDPGYGVKYGIGFINTGMVIAQLQSDFPDASDLEIHTAYLNAQPGTFEQILEYASLILEEELQTPVENWGDVYNNGFAFGGLDVSSSGFGFGQTPEETEPTEETQSNSGGGFLGH